MPADRIAVLGSGSWGTALAQQLERGGASVVLWGKEEESIRSIQEQHENSKYFPGLKLSPRIHATANLSEALEGASVVVIAVPSIAVRGVAEQVKALNIPQETLVISTAKGLERGSHKRMHQVLEEELGNSKRILVLSGPSFAREVVLGLPTAVVLAGSDANFVKQGVALFHHGAFRVYSSQDVIGVELGGVVKNVIALATGMLDGVGFGNNARAALLTRGLAELQRLVLALGGEAATIGGLSGMGDLLLTATGDLSRNRQAGLRLGRGEKLEDVLLSIGQTVEGVETAAILFQLAEEKQVSVPIIEQIYLLVSGKTSVTEAAKSLLSREPKEE